MAIVEYDFSVNPFDPRVVRTRNRVLAGARSLMEEGGSAAITYSALAARSGVTRPTLYRHWPSLPILFRDLVPDITPADKYASLGDRRQRLVAYLRQVRSELAAPGDVAPFLALMNRAEHDDVARVSLKSVVADRVHVTNQVGGIGPHLSPSDIAQLVGPLIFCRLIQRVAIGNALIDQVVDRWLAAQK